MKILTLMLAPFVVARFFLWILPFDFLKRRFLKPKNLYLTGNFGPISQELQTSDLRVVGTIPKDLQGAFVRNGPNPAVPVSGTHHWFQGDGMLHCVEFKRGGSLTYSNRYVRTESYLADIKAGKPAKPSLGNILTPSGMFLIIVRSVLKEVYARVVGTAKKYPEGTTPLRKRIVESPSVANTALTYHDRRVLALVEADFPVHVTAPKLDTIGRYDYNGKLSHTMTAHPKIDPETGELIFFGYNFMYPVCHYSVVSAAGELLRTLEIPLEKPVMMHDFAITKNFSVLMDLPLTFDVARIFSGGSPLQFEPDRRSRFGILPRHAKSIAEIKWFSTGSCYIFHTANAWEEDGGNKIVLIACRSKRTDVLDAELIHGTSADEQRQATMPILFQFEFNMITGTVNEKALDKINVEFPVIHPSRLTLPIRYVFAASFLEQSNVALADGVMKYDLKTGEKKRLAWGIGRYGGEAVFVPREGATEEDDGYLMTFVFEEATHSSELILLDARDLKELARVPLPQRVPYGFHGMWLTPKQISEQRLTA